MAVFSYKAVLSGAPGGGGEVDGTISADSPRHAREKLREQGLVIHEMSPLKDTDRYGWFRLPFINHRTSGNRVSDAQMVTFVRELSTLLAVGIPLLQALDTILKQYEKVAQKRILGFRRKHAFYEVLLQLRENVAAGESLGDAMAGQPQVFDELILNIVRVGEHSGTLDTVLESLADYKERVGQLKGRITTALIYPICVFTMTICITLLLMTFVVPNILEPLTQAGKPLPGVTMIVKGLSDLVLGWWWLLLMLAALLVIGITLVLRSDRGQLLWHRWQLRLPLLGDGLRKQSIVRMAIVMSTLIKSGIVFLQAVRIARQTMRNRVMADALERCDRAVQAGVNIGEALEGTDAFPPTVVQIFAIGQQSGRLEEMLDRLAADYDRQVYTAAQRFTALLEPVMILFLAIIVGFIAFATILPILEAGNVL